MILKAPTTNTQTSKAGIRPAIGATTKALSTTMLTLAEEFPQLLSNTLGTATAITGMAFDAVQQARFEGQLENIDETAEIVGWSKEQVKQAKLEVMKAWGIELPSGLEQA